MRPKAGITDDSAQERVLCRCRLAALLWRGGTLALGGWGLYLLIFAGRFSSQSLCYFTTQSNILATGMFAALTVGTAAQLGREGRRGTAFHLPAWLQLGVTFLVQITFLVFALFLSGGDFRMDGSIGVSSTLLHYVVPLAALADWIFFLPHGRVNYRHTALWLGFPAAYVAFTFLRAELGEPFGYSNSRFPYFFMDADVLGWKLLWIAPAFFAAYFALGALMTWIDRRLGKRT